MKKYLLPLVLLLASSAFAQHVTLLTITWTPSGDPPLIFLIERSAVSGGPYTTICGGTGQPACPEATPTATYADSAGIVGGATWYYVVAASGPGGVGPVSNELKVQTPFLPPTTAPSVSAVPK